jgi:DNA processing protein
MGSPNRAENVEAGVRLIDAPYAASIAALGVGRATMRSLLEGRGLGEAWDEILAGDHPVDTTGSLARKARPEWPEVFAKRLDECDAAVLVRGLTGFPEALSYEPDAPEVLFCMGDPAAMSGRARVAVVGTRSATRYGLEVATELGSGLSGSNVVVVSGLAPGVDSAAHAGAVGWLDGGAPPVAVIAPGVDIASPKSTTSLRDAVAATGVVVSELPPGVRPERWRFADRNRLLAKLSHVVVVVECHRSGGAMYTVLAAREHEICVMAVPGSVFSSASSGTNALIADGAPPARDLEDVLTAVELAISGNGDLVPPTWPKDGAEDTRGRRPKAPRGICARVFAVLEAEPASLEEVVKRCGETVGRVAVALDQLEELTLADGEGGWWRRRGNR